MYTNKVAGKSIFALGIGPSPDISCPADLSTYLYLVLEAPFMQDLVLALGRSMPRCVGHNVSR